MKTVLMSLLRVLAKQPIDWEDPKMVRIQQETRLHFCKQMSTFEMIMAIGIDEEDRTALLMTLTEINVASTQKTGARA